MDIFNHVINRSVRIEGLGYGSEVTPKTLRIMSDMINQSIKNYYVRRWAEKIVERSAEDDLSKVLSVYHFLEKHTQYLKDPFGIELLKSPVVSLQLIEAGEIPSLDCDDLVILSLSLLKSIGFRVGMRAVSYTPEKVYTHVYGLVYVEPYGWLPFDLVKNLGVGNEAPLVKYHYIDVEV